MHTPNTWPKDWGRGGGMEWNGKFHLDVYKKPFPLPKCLMYEWVLFRKI